MPFHGGTQSEEPIEQCPLKEQSKSEVQAITPSTRVLNRNSRRDHKKGIADVSHR